MMTMMMMMT